jgi:predicted kinase
MKVIIGIGVPGCGKTTLLKPLAEKDGLVYVNRDDIRQQVTGDPTDHSKEKQVTELQNQQIAAALSSGKGVIIDGTYSKRRDRREVIVFCKSHGSAKIIGYWFKTPLDICLQRNKLRQRIVPDEIMQKMYRRLELNPPQQDEGFSEIREVY